MVGGGERQRVFRLYLQAVAVVCEYEKREYVGWGVGWWRMRGEVGSLTG